MKHHILCAMLFVVPVLCDAKVTDFNELISENSKNQKQLHSEVKSQIKESRDLVENEQGRDKLLIVEGAETNYYAPTKKELLFFDKEKKFERQSDKKQLKRLASEISNLDQD